MEKLHCEELIKLKTFDEVECNEPISEEVIREFEEFAEKHKEHFTLREEDERMEIEKKGISNFAYALGPVPGASSNARHRINKRGTINTTAGEIWANECFVANERGTVPETQGYNVYCMNVAGNLVHGTSNYYSSAFNLWSDYGWGQLNGGEGGRLFKLRRTTQVFNASGYADFTLPAGTVVSSWSISGYTYPYLIRITSYQKPGEGIKLVTDKFADTGLRTYSGKDNMNIYGNW